MNTETETTRAVVNAYFQAAMEKDINALSKLFAEDIDWYIFTSPYLPWTGKRSKRSELRELFQTLFDAHVEGEDHMDLQHIFVDDQQAAVFINGSRVVKATGKRFTSLLCMRFTVENGSITKYAMYEDSHEIEKAFLN
jgi:ketosteroid isomerase-like protein